MLALLTTGLSGAAAAAAAGSAAKRRLPGGSGSCWVITGNYFHAVTTQTPKLGLRLLRVGARRIAGEVRKRGTYTDRLRGLVTLRKAVRFRGLDVTVYSSDDKRPPGHLSRQGPPVLRWCAYEADKTHARAVAPDHAYYAAVKDGKDGTRAALPRPARSSGGPATSWPNSATTR